MKENTGDVNTRHLGVEVPAMILAGDVGGTKTLLGLFDTRTERPRPVDTHEFQTTAFEGLTDVVAAFVDAVPAARTQVSGAAFGVAGPVLGDTAELTNVPFTIDAPQIARAFGIPRVKLLNDLEAMGYAVPVLAGDELRELQGGDAIRGGNMALIAAGTGLGQALLHNVNGRFVPSPTEAGHADWAPRTERDIHVFRTLVARFGRAEVEHVVSGIGLRNLHRATHTQACEAGVNPEEPDAPAALTKAALEHRCRGCQEALEIFIDAYGAEAGNLALRSVATAGVFIGGGIAPKILPALTDGRFMRAFRDKGAMSDLVGAVPVKIVLNPDAGLLGAAVYAAGL
jgi:glucokinase